MLKHSGRDFTRPPLKCPLRLCEMEAERRAYVRIGRVGAGRNAVAGDMARKRGKAERNRAEPPGRAVRINKTSGISGTSENRPMCPWSILFAVACTADFVCVNSAATTCNGLKFRFKPLFFNHNFEFECYFSL